LNKRQAGISMLSFFLVSKCLLKLVVVIPTISSKQTGKAYVLQCILLSMVKKLQEKSTVVTVRLSSRDLERVEAVRTLENVDRSTLLKEFIEDGLRRRIIHLYQKGILTVGRAAEILEVSLRQFLEILELEGVPVNWDSESIKEYLKARYGE